MVDLGGHGVVSASYGNAIPAVSKMASLPVQ